MSRTFLRVAACAMLALGGALLHVSLDSRRYACQAFALGTLLLVAGTALISLLVDG
jgi:hypothetical protein